MSTKDIDYYLSRASEERALAKTAAEGIAPIHLELARRYEALAEQARQQPTLEPGGTDLSPA